jgi:hypothetical protein
MKLPLLADVLLYLVSAAARLLSPSPPNSVSGYKKTSLSGWLPLLRAHPALASPLFFFCQPRFPAATAHSRRRFKLQVASNPA